jgi:hypothetical protein
MTGPGFPCTPPKQPDGSTPPAFVTLAPDGIALCCVGGVYSADPVQCGPWRRANGAAAAAAAATHP